MKCPILHASLIVGALALAQAGCHQANKAKTTEYQPKKPADSKPDDPTAWTEKDATRGSSDSGAGNSGLAPGSGIKGTWSSEGQDIERSLGIGK
jgi:hypothetical protein